MATDPEEPGRSSSCTPELYNRKKDDSHPKGNCIGSDRWKGSHINTRGHLQYCTQGRGDNSGCVHERGGLVQMALLESIY